MSQKIGFQGFPLPERLKYEFDAVMEWLWDFNGNWKTYAQFGAEYDEAAKNLNEMLNSPEVAEDAPGYRDQLGATIEGMGFFPWAVSDDLTEEDLIQGQQKPGGKPANRLLAPPRPHLSRMLRDVEFGNPGARPTTLGQRLEQGRQHFATFHISDSDKEWLASELERIAKQLTGAHPG